MKIRDRIKELRRVPASELKPNPKNWRKHSEKQENVMRSVLAEVGFAGACLARELDDGSLMLVDGHLRAETLNDEPVPVLVLDVDEKEADLILATYDPISEMAEADTDAIADLMDGLEITSQEITDLLSKFDVKELAPPDDFDEITDEELDLPIECPKCGYMWSN